MDKKEKETFSAEAKNASPIEKLSVIASQDIFRGSRTVLIQHCDQLYRLQMTKAGKLILVK